MNPSRLLSLNQLWRPAVLPAWVLLLSLIVVRAGYGQDGKDSRSKVPADHAERMRKGTQLFRNSVRQILVSKCLDCHGGKSVKADFDLSSSDLLKASGFVGDSSAESHLLQVIRHEAEPHMPLKADKLPPEEIALIARWIDFGAPYDKPLVEGKGGRIEMQVTDLDREFWAFQRLRSVPIPAVKDQSWCRTPIDQFILAALESRGIRPNGSTDSRTLLRRATFDVLGLPATFDEVTHLEEDDSPDAWQREVDRLLNSPHYGERWARHWMDVARFAESHGYEQDYDRPNAYHYRDFLIRAFNEDLPFNKFVHWQLAGDELAPETPLALMATGFLGAGAFPTQLTEAEFETARYDELDDMVTTTGVAFLGLSVGCARCHDHKYDPIPSVDYYRMAATFTTAIRGELDLNLDPESNHRKQQEWEEQRTILERNLRQFEAQELPSAFAAWLPAWRPTEQTSDWETMQIREIRTESGSQFESQQDGSWLATGNVPDGDVLTIEADSRGQLANSLRIEALTHESLPQKGPGRAPNGNFALGDLKLQRMVSAGTDGVKHQAVEFAAASATHQQNADSLSVAASIDADPVSGWAVDAGGIGRDQAAVFEFREPQTSERGLRWFVTLRLRHPNPKHGLGRFRLSVGRKPGLAPSVGTNTIDPSVLAALDFVKANSDPETPEWKTALAWFASTLPEWQMRQRALNEHLARGPELKLTKVLVTSEGLPKMSHHANDRGFPHFYPETYQLTRGDVHQKQSVAAPGFLQILTPSTDAEHLWKMTPPANSRTSFRRATLARWMTDIQNGAGSLVARVIVNRVWQHHFGRGLVATPNDFGTSGDSPTHPDLLNWLANDLVEHGWQLKRLHRMILNSSVYCQTASYDEARATVDRENQFLWRWAPRRLEAEAIRDSLLAVSGRLDRTMYGPGTLDQNMTRRSVYFFIKRSQLIPMMMLFDWPEHLVSIGRRSSTTIAPQALMFLNSPQGRDSAAALAATLPKELSARTVSELWRRTLARNPTEAETQLLLEFASRQQELYQSSGQPDPVASTLIDLSSAALRSNEFVVIE